MVRERRLPANRRQRAEFPGVSHPPCRVRHRPRGDGVRGGSGSSQAGIAGSIIVGKSTQAADGLLVPAHPGAARAGDVGHAVLDLQRLAA